MRSFVVTLTLASCIGPIVAIHAIAQAPPANGAQGGNPNNTVPYGAPSAQTPPTHATPADVPSPVATYSGCVQQLPTDKTVLGPLAPKRLRQAHRKRSRRPELSAGHQIDLKGVRPHAPPTFPRLSASMRWSKSARPAPTCAPAPAHAWTRKRRRMPPAKKVGHRERSDSRLRRSRNGMNSKSCCSPPAEREGPQAALPPLPITASEKNRPDAPHDLTALWHLPYGYRLRASLYR